MMNIHRLKDLREDKDLTQNDIAKLLNTLSNNILNMKLELD